MRLVARTFGGSLKVSVKSHAGDVVTKRALLEHVWDFEFEGDPNIVEVYVSRLRRKIGGTTDAPIIETIRGAGYRLTDVV